MLLIINIKTHFYLIAINNCPCNIKKMSPKNNRRIVIVVGTTYRVPDVLVYLSAQEGPMKITRIIRTLKHLEDPKRTVPNPLAPTRTRRNQDLCGKISAKERKDRNLVLNKLM